MLIIENMPEQINIRPELKKVENQYLKLVELEKLLESIKTISWDEMQQPYPSYSNMTGCEIVLKNHKVMGNNILLLAYNIFNYREELKKLLEINNPRECVDKKAIESLLATVFGSFRSIIIDDKNIVDTCISIVNAKQNEPYLEPLKKIVDSYDEIHNITIDCFDVLNETVEILEIDKQSFQNIVSEINCSLGRIVKKIFIIHGRCNNENKDLQDYLLSEFKLESTIMIPASDKGSKTIIEKFEELASECDLAIAILTPDDLISMDKNSYSQPRPNVFFEIGWFFGKIGRGKVKIFMRKDTTFDECTDLQGVLIPRFNKIEDCYQPVKQFLEENGKIIANGH